MITNKEEMDQLVSRFLNGEATPEEAIQLQDWRLADSTNEAHFKELERTHSLAYDVPTFESPDVKKAWKNVSRQITPSETKVIPLWKRTSTYVAVAAVAIIALLIAGVLTSEEPTQQLVENHEIDTPETTEEPTILMASNTVDQYTLKDQSTVHLKPGSSLSIPSDFNANHRDLTLEGSGSFEVIHDEENPFILHVEELEIFDIGTIFHVDTQVDTVRVVVEEGAVELNLNGQTVALAEGDSAFYVISEQIIKRYPTPDKRKDTTFAFDGTSLSNACELLSKFFDKEIVVMDEAIKECTITVTFKNEELTTILDIISLMLDLKVVMNDKTIELYGTGC